MEEVDDSVKSSVERALIGTNILTRPEIEELSCPGIGEIEKAPGSVIDIPVNYLLGKGQKAF